MNPQKDAQQVTISGRITQRNFDSLEMPNNANISNFFCQLLFCQLVTGMLSTLPIRYDVVHGVESQVRQEHVWSRCQKHR